MHNKNNKTTDKLIINMHTTRTIHTKEVASRAGEASSSCPRATTTTLSSSMIQASKSSLGICIGNTRL